MRHQWPMGFNMAADWDFAWAYARQACGDLIARGVLLSVPELPDCHQLHFLQMACEKLCKAHLWSERDDVKFTHNCITGPLPDILDHQLKLEGTNKSSRKRLRKLFSYFAQEIEYLAPSVTKNGQRPDNVEYPWKDHSGNVYIPLDFVFSTLNLKLNPGPQFIQTLHQAGDRLEREFALKAEL